jgi:NACalpha-BTF3-like transcription factor
MTTVLDRGFRRYLDELNIIPNKVLVGTIHLKASKPAVKYGPALEQELKAQGKIKTVKQGTNSKIVFDLLTYYQFLFKCNYCYNYYIINTDKICTGFRPDCRRQHFCNQVSGEDLDNKDIDVVSAQTNTCYQCCVRVLIKCNNDIVDACVELTI